MKFLRHLRFLLLAGCAAGSLHAPAGAVTLGLVSYFTGDNTTADAQGANALTQGTASYAAGQRGQAFNFIGSQGLRYTMNGMPTGSGNRTLEFWVRMTGVPFSESFFAGYGSPGIGGSGGIMNGDYHAGASATQPFLTTWGPAFFSPTNLVLNTWTHVALVTSGGFSTMYLNGSPVYGANLAMDTAAGYFYLGGLDPSRAMIGQLDEIAVYNRPLSTAEIQQDMQNGVLAPEPECAVFLLMAGALLLQNRRRHRPA